MDNKERNRIVLGIFLVALLISVPVYNALQPLWFFVQALVGVILFICLVFAVAVGIVYVFYQFGVFPPAIVKEIDDMKSKDVLPDVKHEKTGRRHQVVITIPWIDEE